MSNENAKQVDVYIDNVTMSYTPGNVIQSNEYYPYGMQTANSWTRDNTTGNNFLANGGTELNTTSQLYDLDFRNYDPTLGRLNQVDLMANKYSSLSPYHFSFNNPVGFVDPSGLDPGDIAYGRYAPGPSWIAGDQAHSIGGGGGGGGQVRPDGSGGYFEDLNGNGVQNGGEVNVSTADIRARFGWSSFLTSDNSSPHSDDALPSGKLITVYLDQAPSGNIYIRLVYEISNTSEINVSDPNENKGSYNTDVASLFMGRHVFGANNSLDGIIINNSEVGDLKDGAAYTTPWNGINFSYRYWGGNTKGIKDLVRHELGHILQYRRYGTTYYAVMAGTSIVSAKISESEEGHQGSWTEWEANTLSYMFFGFPTDWNPKYAINSDYMNAVIKTDFVKNFPGIGN